jgi:hypothetical protein
MKLQKQKNKIKILQVPSLPDPEEGKKTEPPLTIAPHWRSEQNIS